MQPVPMKINTSSLLLMFITVSLVSLQAGCSQPENLASDVVPGSAAMQTTTMQNEALDAAVYAMIHSTVGVVERINQEKGTVTLSHDPVGSLLWPAMTMRYTLQYKSMADQFAEGERVQFDFIKDKAEYVITSLKKFPYQKAASPTTSSPVFEETSAKESG
jgi:Cu/Ag efflux protein CusF